MSYTRFSEQSLERAFQCGKHCAAIAAYTRVRQGQGICVHSESYAPLSTGQQLLISAGVIQQQKMRSKCPMMIRTFHNGSRM